MASQKIVKSRQFCLLPDPEARNILRALQRKCPVSTGRLDCATAQRVNTILFSLNRLFPPSAITVAVVAMMHFPAQAAAPAAPEQLSLQAAESMFREHNRELVVARRAVEGGEADVVSAAAPPNPNLSVGTVRISPGLGINYSSTTEIF